MEKKEIQRKIEEYAEELKDLEKKSGLESKYLRKSELEAITNSDGFWNDIDKTKDVIQDLKNINSVVEKFELINNKVSLINEMIDLELSENDLIEMENELKEEWKEYYTYNVSNFGKVINKHSGHTLIG